MAALRSRDYAGDSVTAPEVAMSTALPSGWEEALRLVQAVEDAFAAADLQRIAAGFTEDAVARFADFPELRGRAAIMEFLGRRFARTRGYRLKKTLHCLMGDILGNSWEASWQDAQTGKAMLGRGLEFWIVRDGRIARWDATFNAWEKDGPPVTPVV
jgi:nuclear transport factor 2 (NTF2) superfamily protein